MSARSESCSCTGRSSSATTGSLQLNRRAYSSSTSSIRSMYGSSNSATHHIFFPPRLELVRSQNYSNRLSAEAVDHSSLDCVLSQQAYRPARLANRRRPAREGNQCRLLGAVEFRLRAFVGPRLLAQRV